MLWIAAFLLKAVGRIGGSMETIIISLSMLLAVIASGIFTRVSPVAIPLPLVQICLGMLIAAVTGDSLQIEPHVFFLLFLPPLLFLDGWRIPKDSLSHDKMTVLSLAIGLVVFTVLGAGIFIHWLIPAIPLPVAFALAAIISPTDPVAVSAICARVSMPARLMHILEGEALLNDASGLVCMRLAVAAMLTGVFSLYSAIGSFIWLAIGGLAVGIFISWVISTLRSKLSVRYGEQPEVEILISLLIPFASYMTAETLECSGILAAVASGITMSFMDYRGTTHASTRVQRNAVWDTVQFTLNGIIFVLLGEQLPSIIAEAEEVVLSAGHASRWWLYTTILLIYIGLLMLRFIWVWVSLMLVKFRAKRYNTLAPKMGLRLLIASTLAGVRGAITLGGIMTLPLTMLDGAEFPGRDLAIFLAAGIIIVSLIVASITLPLVLKGLQLSTPDLHKKEEREARISAAEAAIAAIESTVERRNNGDGEVNYSELGSQLIIYYRNRIEEYKKGEDSTNVDIISTHIESELWRIAFHAERKKIYDLRKKSELTEVRMNKIMLDIDLAELRLATH